MDRPPRETIKLSQRERDQFQRLVSPLEADPSETKLSRRTVLRVAFWRHLAVATLLIPVGIAVMVVGVLTWWPVGLIGAPLVALGLIAGLELVVARLVRWGIVRRSNRRSGS